MASFVLEEVFGVILLGPFFLIAVDDESSAAICTLTHSRKRFDLLGDFTTSNAAWFLFFVVFLDEHIWLALLVVC